MSGNYRHGKRYTRIYNIWRSMRQRCNNPKCKNYHNYGGKGIAVCEEWQNDFMNFYVWSMENGYADNLTLDRIETSGNYEPSNCRWATYIIQANNRTVNRFIEVDGVSHTLAEWSKLTGIKVATIHARLKYGWTPKEAISIRPIVGSNKRRKKVV